MNDISNEVAELGQRVTFTAGPMEVRGGNGRTGQANGIHQVNRDGSVQYFIRADSKKYTAGMIFAHERFHDIVSNNQGLWLDMVDDLFRTHTEEEISRMVDAYVKALDGIYGVYEEGMTEDEQAALRNKYLEEIFADQYAGMNRGGGKQNAAREIAGQTAQRFAGDIENARQNRAGIENRNGPGTRLAIDENDNVVVDDEVTRDSVENTLKSIFDGNRKQKSFTFTVLKHTPKIITEKCKLSGDRSMVMTSKKARKAMIENISGQHNLGVKGMMEVIDRLSDPNYIIYQGAGEHEGHHAVLIDIDGNEHFVALDLDSYRDGENTINGEEGYYNVLVTAFIPREGYIDSLFSNPSNVVVYDKYNKTDESNEPVALSDPRLGQASSPSSKDIVSYSESKSNNQNNYIEDEEKAVDWNGNREEPEARLSAADEDDESLGVDWFGSRDETGETNPSTTAQKAQRSPSPVTSDRGGQDAGRGTTETGRPSSVTAEAVTPSPEGEGFGSGTTETRDEGRETKDEGRGALDVRRYGDEGMRVEGTRDGEDAGPYDGRKAEAGSYEAMAREKKAEPVPVTLRNG